jgi:hypothetical protein
MPVESDAAGTTPVTPVQQVPAPAAPPLVPSQQSPAPAVSQPPPASPTAASIEVALVVIPFLNRVEPDNRRDPYYLIFTEYRSVFAKLTAEVLQKGKDLWSQKNPAQSKSFFGRWKAQVAGPDVVADRYRAIPPEEALKESPENFTVDNARIQRVKCTYYFGEENSPSEWHIHFQMNGELLKFITTTNPEKLLKQAYAGKFTK